MMNKSESCFHAMKNMLRVGLRISLLTMVTLTGFAEENPSQPATELGFDRFQILWERNIFNPDRQKKSAQPVIAETTKVESPIQITLVGTLVVDDRAFAFFDGNQSEFNTTLQVGGVIGSLTVTAISPQGVQCESPSGQVEIQVGTGVRQRPDGSWDAASEQLLTRSNNRNPSSRSRSTNTSEAKTESPSDPKTNDVLSQLRARRQQENQK